MRTYHLERKPSGVEAVVRETGQSERRLKPRLDLRNHSPAGLEFGYSGSGPAQTALAILADALQNDSLAVELHQQFKAKHVAKASGDAWSITETEVRRWASGVKL